MKHYRLKVFSWSVFLVVCLCTLAAARQVGQVIIKPGSTAEFARAYPYVMLAAIGVMGVIIWYLLRQKDAADAKKLQEANDNFRLASDKLDRATVKIDATINTLFEHDRQIEARVAKTEAAQVELETTCRMNRELCHARAGIECMDRRVKTRRQESRREANGDNDDQGE